MSIQSTLGITRQAAIARIKAIYGNILARNYRELESISFEPNADIQVFIDNSSDCDISNIEQWTDKMLKDKIDEPFFRQSIFDNYLISNQDSD